MDKYILSNFMIKMTLIIKKALNLDQCEGYGKTYVMSDIINATSQKYMSEIFSSQKPYLVTIHLRNKDGNMNVTFSCINITVCEFEMSSTGSCAECLSAGAMLKRV